MSLVDELEKDMLKQEILNKDLVIDNFKKENAELNSYIEYLKEGSKGHFDQAMRNGLEATELRAKLEKLKTEAQNVLYIGECRCEIAWTSRYMHEPNTFCGEMDDLKETLKELRVKLERSKEALSLSKFIFNYCLCLTQEIETNHLREGFDKCKEALKELGEDGEK